MPQNLEIKARIVQAGIAITTARHLKAQDEGILEQTDTYYRVEKGRLKLREIRGSHAELIFYLREEDSPRRVSNFQIYPVHDVPGLKEILSQSLGIRAEVKKTRTLFMYERARIHIDDVRDLGSFIEFEVPIDGEPREAEKKMRLLMIAFQIRDNDCIRQSYAEMLTGASQ